MQVILCVDERGIISIKSSMGKGNGLNRMHDHCNTPFKEWMDLGFQLDKHQYQ